MSTKRLEKLEFTTPEGYSVEIHLFGTNTILIDDSSTGKSYVYNSWRQLATEGKLPFKCVCFDEDNCTALEDILAGDCTALLVIDNFDIIRLRFPALIDLFNTYKHQTLIIGRNIDGISTHIQYMCKLYKIVKKIIGYPLIKGKPKGC